VVASCTKLVSPVGAPPHKRGADDKYHMENGVGGGAVGVVLDLCLYNKFLRDFAHCLEFWIVRSQHLTAVPPKPSNGAKVENGAA